MVVSPIQWRSIYFMMGVSYVCKDFFQHFYCVIAKQLQPSQPYSLYCVMVMTGNERRTRREHERAENLYLDSRVRGCFTNSIWLKYLFCRWFSLAGSLSFNIVVRQIISVWCGASWLAMLRIMTGLLCGCQNSARLWVPKLVAKVGGPWLWPEMVDIYEQVDHSWTLFGPVHIDIFCPSDF